LLFGLKDRGIHGALRYRVFGVSFEKVLEVGGAIEETWRSLPLSKIILLGAHDVGWKSILAHLYGLEGSDHPYEVIRSYENSVPSERDFYLLFTVIDDIWMFINPASSRRERSES